MTQAQLAAAIGRDQSVVSDMERGKAFRVDVLPLLCDALGVSLDYLIYGTDQASEAARLFRRLTPEQRASVLAVVRTMLPLEPPID